MEESSRVLPGATAPWAGEQLVRRVPLEFGAEHNMDPTAEIEQQLRQGSFFVQARLEQQGELANRLDAYLTGLLDILLETGAVDADRLSQVVSRNRRQQATEQAEQLDLGSGQATWPTVMVRQASPDDKTEPDTPVDCAARMHICKAACCSLRFPLSAAEVEAGEVKWDLGHPYMVRHTDQGFCIHNDRTTGACSVYDNRPQVCSSYSCATDGRIWADFDNMVLNEDYLSNRAPPRFRCSPAEPSSAVPVTFVRKDDANLHRPEAGRPDTNDARASVSASS